MADPPMSELLLKQHALLASSSLPVSGSGAPFRKMLAGTIESYATVDNDGDDDDEQEYRSEEEPTSIIEELCYIARESKLWISGGGVHTKVISDDEDESHKEKIYNTHVIIDSEGRIRAHYHKIHLFDVFIPNKVNLRESNTTTAGNKLVVCDSPIGNLGVSICYDMRFSEMYVDLLKMGAQVLLMPSAFTVPTGKAHWHALLRARAIESQCYVIAAAQCGQHNEKRQSYGHSVVYDPWGEMIADAGGYDGAGSAGSLQTSDESPVRVPSIILADIDIGNKLASIRERMPMQQHRDDSSFTN